MSDSQLLNELEKIYLASSSAEWYEFLNLLSARAQQEGFREGLKMAIEEFTQS